MGADQYGFRTIIAPSYADIFFNNSPEWPAADRAE
jgi:3-isopropylmalate dehydratase small subunit